MKPKEALVEAQKIIKEDFDDNTQKALAALAIAEFLLKKEKKN